ncbi:MAG: phosphonoacetate hydrolase [Verrucomicrobia bacterium]|nr:phosphonoacetate hydrolase [Verrucomicrobiota bacterium]
MTSTITVNGRNYALPPRPVVVICLDGSSDEYLDAALVRRGMAYLERMCVTGHRGLARAAMPTFTNVNNASIVTGVPPSVHGICGNYFYDTTTGREVMMNSAKFLRVETILAAAARAGRKVAAITAKEKLREILASGLVEAGGIAFSAEMADQAKPETHGIKNVERLAGQSTPSIYSAEASLFVLQAGAALLEQGTADFLYLSTTDYVQHLYPPDAPEAVEFYGAIDVELGRMKSLGAVLGITADHGMNAKQRAVGQPNVIYLESELTARYGAGFRVILPIIDPYVVHHGSLGSFALVHLPPETNARRKFNILHFLSHFPGVTEVYGRNAAHRLELPPDRLGDIVVMSGRDVVLGRTPESHDLKALRGGLRSHGGRYEEMVPLILSEPLNGKYAAKAAADPRNFDAFDFVLNGTGRETEPE